VIAEDQTVELDMLRASKLRERFEAFPGLGMRFYRSLAVVLACRLRETSWDLAQHRQAAGR
jgi:hypothetical protein